MSSVVLNPDTLNHEKDFFAPNLSRTGCLTRWGIAAACVAVALLTSVPGWQILPLLAAYLANTAIARWDPVYAVMRRWRFQRRKIHDRSNRHDSNNTPCATASA